MLSRCASRSGRRPTSPGPTCITGRPTLAGQPERLAEIVGHYVEAGLDELIVPDPTLGHGNEKLEHMDRIIEEVAAAFR